MTPKLLDKDSVLKNEKTMIEFIKQGFIFVYPTDTIYGIGCNATDSVSVSRLRSLKQIDERPLSIIAPSKKWIFDNFVVSKDAKEWLDKLPDKYTFIMNPIFNLTTNLVLKNVNPSGESIGVRIPDNWFTDLISKAGVPFITTSANISSEKNMTNKDDLNPIIKDGVDFIVYDGELSNNPSVIVDLTSKPRIIRK